MFCSPTVTASTSGLRRAPPHCGHVEEEVLLLGGQVLPRLVEVDLPLVRDALDHRLVEARAACRPRDERAFADRERRVGHEQIGVDLLLRAKARAARAGAVRRVEREDPGLELGQPDPVLRAREALAERERVAVEHVDDDEAVRERSRGFDRLPEARAQIRLHHEPVDDDLDRVLELLVEDDLVFEHPHLAVHLHAREPVGAELLEDVLVLALAVADDRRVDRELRALRKPQHLVDDGFDRLARDRPSANRAVRPADPRIEEAQIVVDLGHRADGRPRVARSRLLVDRDRRREPVDRVDVRLLHHLQELACVRGERVVLAGAVNYELVRGHNRPSLATLGRTNKCSLGSKAPLAVPTVRACGRAATRAKPAWPLSGTASGASAHARLK